MYAVELHVIFSATQFGTNFVSAPLAIICTNGPFSLIKCGQIGLVWGNLLHPVEPVGLHSIL